jgi:hypothetical protein
MNALNNGVADFAKRNLGKQVGNGTCWTLVERALESVGGKTSNDLTKNKKNFKDADYVWGKLITIEALQTGDIIQFRNHTFRATKSDGSNQIYIRGHHSAIVASSATMVGVGVIYVYESHVNGSGNVQTNIVYLKSGSYDGIGVVVEGTICCYRPIKK